MAEAVTTGPDGKLIFLLAGMPGAGKSTFASYLQEKLGFAHFNMERDKAEWPEPAFRDVWERSRAEFVSKLKERYDRVVLDWGFPVGCLGIVKDLLALGVRPVWFEGDEAACRRLFVKRGTVPVENFDAQVQELRVATEVQQLPWLKVQALDGNGAPVASAILAAGLGLDLLAGKASLPPLP